MDIGHEPTSYYQSQIVRIVCYSCRRWIVLIGIHFWPAMIYYSVTNNLVYSKQRCCIRIKVPRFSMESMIRRILRNTIASVPQSKIDWTNSHGAWVWLVRLGTKARPTARKFFDSPSDGLSGLGVIFFFFFYRRKTIPFLAIDGACVCAANEVEATSRHSYRTSNVLKFR